MQLPLELLHSRSYECLPLSIPMNAFCLTAEIAELMNGGTIAQQLPDVACRLGDVFQADSSVVSLGENNLPNSVYWYSEDLQSPSDSEALRDWLTDPQFQQSIERADLFQVISVMARLPNAVPQPSLPYTLNTYSGLLIKTGMAGTWNGVVGLLRVYPQQWSQAEIKGLEIVAQTIAIAATHLTHISHIATLQRQTHRAAERQSLLDRLTAAIRGSLELTDIQHMAIAGVTELLGGDRGLILLLNYADPLLKYRALVPPASAPSSPLRSALHHAAASSSEDPDPQETQKSTIRAVLAAQWWRGDRPHAPSPQSPSFFLSECEVCQQALANPHELIVIPDARDNVASNALGMTAALFQIETFPGLLLAPLENRGTVLGFLVVQYHSPQTWQFDDLKLVEQVSNQVSMAIIQLQTLRQVRALVDERTAQLCRSLEVQAKLYEVTRRQVSELQSLNQMKDDFLSTVNHELRTPLTSMRLAIRMLRQPGLSDRRYAHYLDILEESCDHEIELVNDLLMLQELELMRFVSQPEWVDFVALITDLALGFREKWQTSQIELITELPDRLSLQSNQDNLRRVLVELLTNTEKYAFPHTQVTLGAKLEGGMQNNHVVLTLRNIGIGIEPQELDHIFETFRQGSEANQRVIHGTGLGLALVKGLVNYMQGTIAVTSQPVTLDSVDPAQQPYETCFTIRLPQYLTTNQATP